MLVAARRSPCLFQAETLQTDPGSVSVYADVVCRFDVARATGRLAAVWASVSELLAPCDPAAISRFVWAIVINAVDGVAGRWLRPHVGQERLEVAPALTDSDASATVVRPATVVWVAAPRLHRAPTIVLWALGALRGMPVNPVDRRESPIPATPAILHLAATEPLARVDSVTAAIADAEPKRLSAVPSRYAVQDGQLAEAMAGNVHKYGHLFCTLITQSLFRGMDARGVRARWSG